MPRRPPALRIMRALSAPPSSVSWCPSVTACGIPNSAPWAMLAHSNCRAGITGAFRLAALVGAVDDEDEPLHADLSELGVPVHQPTGAADLPAAAGQARPEHQVLLDGPLQPDVDVVQRAAAAGRGIAALERQLRV